MGRLRIGVNEDWSHLASGLPLLHLFELSLTVSHYLTVQLSLLGLGWCAELRLCSCCAEGAPRG